MGYKEEFAAEVQSNIDGIAKDRDLQDLSRIWMRDTIPHKYAYNFRWMGRPIIQEPQDIVAIQELIWDIKPDLVIDVGVAHGGSTILCASILALLDFKKIVMGEHVVERKVLGIDIDIRDHNVAEIEKSPVNSYIDLLQGSSIDENTVNVVKRYVENSEKVLVFLDSNHTHDHVLRELEIYAPMVSKDSYCVVFDTGIEDLPEHFCQDRPWGKGSNPKTAVWEFMKDNESFKIDKDIEHKLLITAAPDGFIRRVK